MEELDTKKIKLYIKVGMPVLALLFILIFLFLPIKFINSAVNRESEENGTAVHRIINIDLIKGL